MAANYAFHDLSRIGGRVLAVADIHGCFDLLEQELEAIGFNGDAAVLISLGDIVDRGPKDGTDRSPESLDIMRRLRALRIRGNHEIFAAESAAGDIEAQNLHAVNGGMWLAFTPEEERHKFVELANAPVAIEVLTPGGHRVGFVHASVPTMDWAYFVKLLGERDPYWTIKAATEDRDHIDRVRYRKVEIANHVQNIDHVFMGHTRVREPLRYGNCTWFDCGAYGRGRLPIIDVDAWLRGTDSTAAAA